MNKIIPKLIGTYLNTMSLVAPAKAGRQGFYLFCSPLKPPLKRHHLEFLDSSEKFKFELNGDSLQAYRWGSGPRKILFLHGWQSHTYRWKKYIQSFPTDEFTMYAFDAPAHGLSGGKYLNLPIYSNAIVKFFEEYGPVEAAITHSMGSFSILHALYHQDLPLDNLVLMGVPGEAAEFFTFYRSTLGLTDRTVNQVLHFFQRELSHTPSFYSAPRFAEKVNKPGLIIHDEKDAETPYFHAQRIHSAWPQSKLITTNGLGHNLKSPDVVKMVADFVGKKDRSYSEV